MAAASDAIWAIDLGNNSLKALHLMAVGDVVQVIGFDHVPHGKILSSSGISTAEREELVAVSLRQFVQRNDVGYDPIIISVPSQNSFARFVTLPPVEAKRLPEIVRFEAAQQIPFDMNEVQWDWQLLSNPDDAEKKVGLFAIKNDIVNAAMEPFDAITADVSPLTVELDAAIAADAAPLTVLNSPPPANDAAPVIAFWLPPQTPELFPVAIELSTPPTMAHRWTDVIVLSFDATTATSVPLTLVPALS